MEELNKNELLEDSENFSEVTGGKKIIEDVIDEEKNKKHQDKKDKFKKRLYVILAAFVVVIALLVYLSSEAANVKSIKIVGNYFLSDEYIEEITGINSDSKFILVNSLYSKFKAKQSDLIDDVTIKKGNGNSIVITVEENTIVGYRYDEAMELILADGTIIEFESSYIDDLSLIPMFIGVSDDKTIRVAQELGNLDFEILSRISEVKDFALSYDDDMVKFVMEDGYIVYTSISGVGKLQYYLQLVDNTTSPYSCIMVDPSNESAYFSSCSEIEEMYQNYLNGDSEDSETTNTENSETSETEDSETNVEEDVENATDENSTSEE